MILFQLDGWALALLDQSAFFEPRADMARKTGDARPSTLEDTTYMSSPMASTASPSGPSSTVSDASAEGLARFAADASIANSSTSSTCSGRLLFAAVGG